MKAEKEKSKKHKTKSTLSYDDATSPIDKEQKQNTKKLSHATNTVRSSTDKNEESKEEIDTVVRRFQWQAYLHKTLNRKLNSDRHDRILGRRYRISERRNEEATDTFTVLTINREADEVVTKKQRTPS